MDAMNRRWSAVAVVVVAVVGIANIVIILAPREAQAAPNSPPVAASPPTNTANPAAHHPPAPPPVQAGLHLDREVQSPSGKLRVEYFRDRQKGVRQIVLQDVREPSNQTVLTQYKRNAWVVVSPDDDWIILESRDGTQGGLQLYHRVSAAPLRYEVPEELRASGNGLRDVVWQSYLGDTQQDSNTDRNRVTIDATAWEPDSHKVSLSVTPIPAKDDSALPTAWTCVYDVTTKQIEPPEVAEGPANEAETAGPNESGDMQPENGAATDSAEAAPAAEETTQFEGEKFAATREEPITVANANELELSDVKYAINEMFARHGANFKDAKIKKTFAEFSWYQPRTDVIMDDVEKEFSEVEKSNLAVLRRCRDAKLAAARRTERKVYRGQQVPDEDGQRVLRGVLQGVSDALNGGDQ
jgi:hypothetical protein